MTPWVHYHQKAKNIEVSPGRFQDVSCQLVDLFPAQFSRLSTFHAFHGPGRSRLRGRNFSSLANFLDQQKPREIQPPQWLLCHETAEKMAVKGCGWMIRIIIPEPNNSHGKAITPNSYTCIAPLWDIAPRFILMASNSRQPIVFLIALRPLDREPLIQKP